MTSEQIKNIEKGLQVCASGDTEQCPECPYHLNGCEIALTKDTLDYIEYLKAGSDV